MKIGRELVGKQGFGVRRREGEAGCMRQDNWGSKKWNLIISMQETVREQKITI